jgi:hypothetical protein
LIVVGIGLMLVAIAWFAPEKAEPNVLEVAVASIDNQENSYREVLQTRRSTTA